MGSFTQCSKGLKQIAAFIFTTCLQPLSLSMSSLGYALRNAAAMSCWLRASAGSASHIRPRRFWMGISPKCALSHVTRFSLPRNSRCRLKYKAFISLFQRYMNLEMFLNPKDIHVQHRFIFILRFQRVSAVRAVCWSLISPDTLFTADETGIVVAWDARINRWDLLGNLGHINMQVWINHPFLIIL